MPTLRHTKSDEHLDQLCDNPENSNQSSKTSTVLPNNINAGKRSCGIPRISSNLEVFNDDDVWSQEDDEITAQYLRMTQHKKVERDSVSQFSIDSYDSAVREMSKSEKKSFN